MENQGICSVSQAAPKPVTLKLMRLEPPTVFCSRSTRISPLLAHPSQHGLLGLQQGDVLLHQLDCNSAPLPLLVWRRDGAGDAHAGVEALQPAARPATGQAERPQRATAPGAAAASAPSWRADDDRRAASAEWAPSPRAPPASCAAFAAAASCATKPSRTASETQHSRCSMRGRHTTNETMTILARMALSTDQEASLPALSEEHATIFVYVLCV